ncbi:MAG: hypothetical protein RKO66_00635 [Candidatus Contendobacter sp.]|nr:hypothetical protein [Candidatus Contendobacter sp.]MDS4059240.1 hypothetical protein [Candidatus Contendobacter sp.]
MQRALFPILALLLLAACANRPGDSEIERQITERLLREGGSLYVVENFRKTNGFEPSQNVYVAEVEYDLVFQKSLADLALNLRDRSDPLLAGLDLVALGLKYGQFQAGERRHRAEKATFHKTERGWLLQNDR